MQSKELQLIMNLEYVSENNILWSKYYLVVNGGNTIFISDLVFESFQKGWFCWFLPIDSAALFTTTGWSSTSGHDEKLSLGWIYFKTKFLK